MLHHLLSSVLLFIPTVWALLDSPNELENCSRTSSQPCKCPDGTDYNTCTTYITIGANVFDVRNLTADFFDLDWIPQTIKATHGPDNTTNSTRTTTIAIDCGVYDWVEELIKYELEADGSFLWEFRLKNVPLPFNEGPGYFAGEWVTYKAERIDEYETKVTWNLYGCHTGGLHGYSEFQPATLKHVQTLLGQMGKIKGRNSDPYTETGLARQISLASPRTKGAASDGSGSQKVLYAPRAAQWGRVWRAW